MVGIATFTMKKSRTTMNTPARTTGSGAHLLRLATRDPTGTAATVSEVADMAATVPAVSHPVDSLARNADAVTSEVIDGPPGRWHGGVMTEITTVIDTYIAAWNEPDADRRRALVAEAFTEDASYVDPLMTGAGVDGIADMIGAAQQQFPGHRFVLAAGPDAHHDRVRFVWHLTPLEGDQVTAVGHDFADVAEDGRLRKVTGFLEA